MAPEAGRVSGSERVDMEVTPRGATSGLDADRTVADPGRDVEAALTPGSLRSVTSSPTFSSTKPFAELFGLDAKFGLRSRDRKPIIVNILGEPDQALKALVPRTDPRYVFHPELTKNVVMALEENLTLFLTGHTGTGKTTAINQVCALTNRPRVRVQHTVNTEAGHITGQWVVRNKETMFQPGPLPFAMMRGLVYLADEFDMALPSVAAVYQAVMEHEALFIPDAPEEFRVVEPHPQFRFCATGNTGGNGDETGLYQGTQIMNSANFSRWEVTDVVNYHDAPTETAIIRRQARIPEASAEKLVKLADSIRKAFAAGKIANTIGPRELVNAARIGRIKGADYRAGLRLSFSNRLSSVDRITVDQMAQRIFG